LLLSSSTLISPASLLPISPLISHSLRRARSSTLPLAHPYLQQRVYKAREEQYSIVRSPLIRHGSFNQIPEHLLPAAAGKVHQEASMVKVVLNTLSIIRSINYLIGTLIATSPTVHLTLMGNLYSPHTQHSRNCYRHVRL
jgi:hypothetical protein